jgi:opacity protein-like surface antigen
VEFFAADKSIHFGIAAGVGFEYMWTPNWIIGAEFLYVDLLTKSSNIVCTGAALAPGGDGCGGVFSPPFTAFRYGFGATAETARVRLSYKFGGL